MYSHTPSETILGENPENTWIPEITYVWYPKIFADTADANNTSESKVPS